MDEDAVPKFRTILFKIGERAVAELARDLSQVKKDDIKDKEDAEEVVYKLDQIAYFARSNNPIAHASIKELALRPVSWNPNGELINPIEANISFEMFDIYSQYQPAAAMAFIGTIDKKYRPAYFTRYAYGRKLAGKTLEEIDQELKNVFGSPELALK